MDRYFLPHRGTATPSVTVFVSLLDVSLDDVRSLDLRQVAASSTQTRAIRLFTGYIPRLVLGTVFRDGVEVASLPLETMQINDLAVRLETLGVMDELARKPKWWTYPYRVINRRDYDLAGCLRSHAVVVASSDTTLVLPCHEVFRTMYAPFSGAAIALTSGPWEITKSRVIEPTNTGVRADGRWQIVLRTKTQDKFAHVLANLCLSDAGREGANGIYTTFLESDGPGYMKVPMPFNISKLKLQVRGIWLDSDPRKFLALQISSMNWPVDIETVYQRTNSGEKGVIQTPVEKPKPYSKRGTEPSADIDGFINANSMEDPSAYAASTTFSLPSMQWCNLPSLKKEEKLESFIYAGASVDRQERCLTSVAAGTEWYGESSSGPATYSQDRRDASLRFVEVVDMLDRLRADGEIEHWKCVPHPKPRLVVGGLPVWHFPTKVSGAKKPPGFCYLGRKNKRLRSALLCEIHYRGSATYWLDIEVDQSGGGFRSMVFSVSAPDLAESIYQILEVAALNRGVWPKAEEIVARTGVASVGLWIHSYIGRKSLNESRRLNEVRALSVIAQNASRFEQAGALRAHVDLSDFSSQR